MFTNLARDWFAMLLICCAAAGAHAQSPSETLDRRFAYDSSVKDAARINAIINRIELEERTIDSQLAELGKNRRELEGLISHLRSLPVPSRFEPVQIPPDLTAISALPTTAERMDVLNKHIAMLESFVDNLRRRDQTMTTLRDIINSLRRDSSSLSFRLALELATPQSPDQIFRSEIGARLSRRLDATVLSCSVRNFTDAVALLRKTKEFKDTPGVKSETDIVDAIRSCFEPLGRPFDLNEVRNAVLTELGTIDTELSNRLSRLNTTLSGLFDAKAKWQTQLRRSVDISSSLIDWTIPLLAISVVVLLLVPVLYKGDVQQSVISSGLILEVFTVFLLITTVLLLGIAEKIQSEALGTLLGGISGYVLGRAAQRATEQKLGNPPPKAEEPDKRDKQ